MNDVAVQRALASLDRLVNASEKDLWDYANVVAVILTLCFLVWYTIETFRLRREAQLQNTGAVMPVVVLVTPTGEHRLPEIVNVGKGPALNIRITLEIPTAEMVVEHPAVLAPGEKVPIKALSIRDVSNTYEPCNVTDSVSQTSDYDQAFSFSWSKNWFPEELPLIVICSAVDRKVYRTQVKMVLQVGPGSRCQCVVRSVIAESA